MRVIVTGAGGFAGSHLARTLTKAGHDVAATSRRPLAPDFLGPNICLIQGDLADTELIRDPFDTLIHCAAEIPAKCPDLNQLYETNVNACSALFGSALTHLAKAVIFLSSMSHYGQIDVEEVTEDLPPQAPDLYGRSKTRGEELLSESVEKGLPSGLSLRLPGTVGQGSHNNFLSTSRDRILSGEKLLGRHPDALFNNIVHIYDLCYFIEKFIRTPQAGYHVANLAARDPVTMREVFSTLFAGLGKPEMIDYSSEGKPPFRISIERASALGYSPLSTLDSVKAFAQDSLHSAS